MAVYATKYVAFSVPADRSFVNDIAGRSPPAVKVYVNFAGLYGM